jgi:hypothetical protein
VLALLRPGRTLPDRTSIGSAPTLIDVAKTEKLPPGPYYEPVTSWREIGVWLVAITLIVVAAACALIFLT